MNVTSSAEPIIATATETPNPMIVPASEPGYQVLTDQQFGYVITVPKTWRIATLKGQNNGVPGSPSWSALIANVEIHSLQSFQPGTAFVLAISQESLDSEDALLARIVDTVETQPGEILRRTQGTLVEYYTTKRLPDAYGKLTQARWFWNGKQLLSATMFLLDPSTPELDRLDQALDSMQVSAP